MKKRLLFSLILGIAAGAVGDLWGHVGDRIYPIWQLSDEEVTEIDLGDGSIQDWIDVMGPPTLLTSDFWARDGYDPSDLGFRIWLAWHEATGRIYVGMERFDDAYVFLENDLDCPGPYCHDAAVNLYVDGDHSGGDFMFVPGTYDTDKETWFYTFQEAQWFTAYTEIFEDTSPIELWYVSQGSGGEKWFAEFPYAEAGGGVFGEDPTVSILEFYVTPFDRLIRDSLDESVASQLRPGQIIGFDIRIYDNDAESKSNAYVLGQGPPVSADNFVDGLLMGADLPGDTAVESNTWARIKASFAR
ncbi:MAG: hypothetical protein HOC74_14590 [Gemmatimonadetes bacterium]|jgi:hypothetical protein|nr:hypothetical protein [Gemmatimonadota bacterium]